MEKYVKPEIEVLEMDQNDVIVASSGDPFSMSVSYQDGAGNWYTTTGTRSN